MGRLDGKVALLTGAASGVRGALMGFAGAAAWMFVREGARVVLTDILDETGERTARQIRDDGGDAQYLRLDVTSEGDWAAVVPKVVSELGHVDVLVNSAGGARGSGRITPELSLEDFRATMEMNCTGTLLGIRAVIAPMSEAGGGSIINVSSIYGIVGGAGTPGYFASKGAVRTLTKAAAVQLADRNIRVNSIHPGFAITPMTVETFSQADEAAIRLDRVPMGKFGTADDIAHAMVYLASDEAAWVTGSELVIDGGLTAG